MTRNMKSMAIICLGSVVVLATLGVSCAMKAIPKKSVSVCPQSSAATPKKITESRCEQALASYLDKFNAIAEKHDSLVGKRFSARIEKYALAERQFAAEKSTLLNQLRSSASKRQGGKLDFRDDAPENAAFIPTSPMSANMFATLCQEGRIDRGILLSKLTSNADILAQEWIPLLRNIADTSKADSVEWRSARFALYKVGVSQVEYRPLLEQWAVQNESWSALEALLYDTDKATGRPSPIKSSANSQMVSKLAQEKASLKVSLICARYAAETGNTDLAEKICLDILSQRYQGLDDPDRLDKPKEDYELSNAKQESMDLLFYRLKSRRGFEMIYRLSQAWNSGENEDTDSPDFKGLTAYSLGRADIEHAKSLIREVSSGE